LISGQPLSQWFFNAPKTTYVLWSDLVFFLGEIENPLKIKHQHPPGSFFWVQTFPGSSLSQWFEDQNIVFFWVKSIEIPRRCIAS